MKLYELTPVFCTYIPSWTEMQEGVLYISEEYGISNHFCACGCKQQTVLPFKKEEGYKGKDWNLINNDGKISITPSIGNFSGENPYHAHYHITENKIVWC